MEIKAVLFDCDGLMFETEIIAQQIWREEAAKYNVELPQDFFVHITGSGGPSRKAYLESIPGMKEVQPEISANPALPVFRDLHWKQSGHAAPEKQRFWKHYPSVSTWWKDQLVE